MKRCELCKGKARLHCASDHASLCWDCDAKVHSANFLVARHFRNLLCHLCQSPMPWSACGAKLGPIFSVCDQCVHGRRRRCDASREEESETAEENHVVTWSPEESTSSIDESISDGDCAISRKRLRIEPTCSNLQSNEDQRCSSSQLTIRTCPPSDSFISTRRMKPPQIVQRTEMDRVEECGSGILDALRRLHREDTGPGEEMAEVCSLSGPSI